MISNPRMSHIVYTTLRQSTVKGTNTTYDRLLKTKYTMTDAAPSGDGVITDARERLRSTFANHDPKTHPDRWDSMWQKNDTPWDKGRPNPALIDFLNAPKGLLPGPLIESGEADQQDMRRRRALVPGCGKGYDVLLLASHGYDAYGVEGSMTAIKAAEEGKRGFENREEYKVAGRENVGRGEAKFLFGNFFEDDWRHQVKGEGGKEGFDLIYDYTFFCALPPALRPQWAERMSQLLGPDGRLVCLEFPTYKSPSEGGPPWAVRPQFYLAYLSRPGQDIEYGEDAVIKGDFDEGTVQRTESGLVRMAHWQPDRSHDIGKGTDWISVWRH